MFNMKDYTKLYTIIFWLSMLYILLWVILKAAGVINTPELLELFPIITAIFGAGVFFQMIRDVRERLTKLESKTENGFRDIDKRLALVESKI